MRNPRALTLPVAVAVFTCATSARAVCPSPSPDPTNDVPSDLESHAPLAYFGPLKVFNIYWSDRWDATNRFKTAEIESALQAIISTPYFDHLCQYGVPGFRWDGGTTTDRFFQTCPRQPGAVTTLFPQTLDFLSCEEGSIGTGVPLSDGLPNPITCPACVLAPVSTPCYVDPACTVVPNPTGARIYNLFLPDTTVLAEAGETCASFAAMHFQIPSQATPSPIGPPFFLPGTQGRPLIFTVIPTRCFASLADLMSGVTHEMVEAATDPLPLAHWIDGSTAVAGDPIGNIGTALHAGEAADLCESQPSTPFTTPGGAQVSVAPYWSNHDNRCVSLDVTPPLTTVSLSPPANAAGWNDAPVTVSLSATDDDSGVQGIHLSAIGAQPDGPEILATPATRTFSAEGVTTISFFADDAVGNVEASRSRTIRIDRTSPLVSATRTPPPNAAGWNNTAVQVSFACSDALSGVAACASSQSLALEGASQSATGEGVDVAGNRASAVAAPIDIDLTPPIIAASSSPPPNGAGWNDTSVTVTFTCSDALSGIASCTAPVTLVAEGAAQSTAGSASDLAGNTAAAAMLSRIDLTPPVVTYAGNASPYTVDQTVHITCVASDALAGIASSTCADITGPAYSFGLGTSVDSATATDVAGNTASSSVQLTVIVTFDSLCTLTAHLSTRPQVNTSLCAKLADAAHAPNANAKRNKLNAYRNEVAAQTGKAFTDPQATVLRGLADAL